MSQPPPGRLRSLLTAHGLVLVDLASAAGVSLETLRRIDRGGDELAGVGVGKLAQVAVALGVPATELAPELAVQPGPGLLAAASAGRVRAARALRDRRLAGG